MNNLLSILISLLTSCFKKVDERTRFEKIHNQKLSNLSNKEQALLNFLAPPVIICIENKDVMELSPHSNFLKKMAIFLEKIKNLSIKGIRFKNPVDVEALLFESNLKELGKTNIKREANNPFQDYLLTLHAPLQWIDNYLKDNSISIIIGLKDIEDIEVSKIIKNIISDNKYIKAINCFLNSSNTYLLEESLIPLKEFRKKLYDKDDEESRKYVLSFSLEEIQKMANDSGMSGIVYEIKVEEGVPYLYERLIISKQVISKQDK